ncbi:MAG: hypothetical protein KME46_11010 [Brasilonema angustatum HA4187-MV1]|jgi:hypothetical protein|nr:hypothetical protein [Brasilonema angustatum HA4187-MV1]
MIPSYQFYVKLHRIEGDSGGVSKMARRRVWEFIKHHLTGEVFTTLQQLRDTRRVSPLGYRLRQVLEKITREQICSLSSYNFILEALFYAASS